MTISEVTVQRATQESSSSQGSTQTTQDAHSLLVSTDRNIWGSLIPCNPSNKHIRRIDFSKDQAKYVIGRSRKLKGDVDVSFRHLASLSSRHCEIIWDGVESSRSAVIVKDLGSRNGTYVNDDLIGSGECGLLKDWSHVSFGARGDRLIESPEDDYRFIFRLMASTERAAEQGLYDAYNVAHVIGTGGYATVVKALRRQSKGERWVAIKMFQGDKLRRTREEGAEIDRTASHLQQEIQVLQRLDHVNIYRLQEAFYEGDSISVVLELCEGGDLMAYILTRDVLLEPEAQDITYQVCDALAYMHKMGVVHRDLKPENILLTSDRPPFVKVADFGFAKILDSLSFLKTQCGTRAYTAPEVLARGAGGYNALVDSWSLGVMVHTMLTGSSPFHEGSSLHEPDWTMLHEYNIVGDGVNFIEALLRYHPDERMSSEQAQTHPWLQAQKAKIRRRRLEREHSLLLASRSKATSAKQSSGDSCAASTETRGKSPLKRGKKRALERRPSLTSLSTNGELPPPRKRARAESKSSKAKSRTSGRAVAGALIASGAHVSSGGASAVPSAGWTRYSGLGEDEVPGLGLLD